MSMFGFLKKKDKCKEDILLKILTGYQNNISIRNIISGKEETPEGYDANDVFSLLVDLSNTTNSLILEIENCDVFSDEEASYWMAHLNQFSASNLRRLGDIEIDNSIAYYEVAIEGFRILETKFPYPYYSIPNLFNDIGEYAYDTPHYAQTRREYASLVSELGDEDRTEKIIIENVKIAKKGFEANQDAFLTYAETLWQACQFYIFNYPKKALKYAEESVNIVEQRADLKTHMENNDLTLLRYKMAYLLSLQKSENWDLADELMDSLKEYGEYKLKAHESIVFEHIKPKGSFTCEDKILKKIHHIHNERSNFERVALEYSKDEALELVNQSLSEINEVIQEIEECKEIDDYWKAHLAGFKGYIYARKSDEKNSGVFYKEASRLLEKLEGNRSFEIPDDVQEAIANISGGYVFNSVITNLGFVTSIKDQLKGDEEFLKLVDRAEKIAPNNENGALITVLRKTGQRFSFPFRMDSKDNKMAKLMFEKGIDFIENKVGLSLEESVNNHDMSLLFFKDHLRMNLERLGEFERVTSIESEIEPYLEYIYWRFEENIGNFE